jgi:hypothetical protein
MLAAGGPGLHCSLDTNPHGDRLGESDVNGFEQLAEGTGWVILGLGVVQVALPFSFRGRPAFENHYGIGFLIAGLSIVHASIAMSAFAVSTTAAAVGIGVAGAGMFLALGQVGLGNRLRKLDPEGRRPLRRYHLAVAAVLALAAVAHLLLDGPVTRGLLQLR